MADNCSLLTTRLAMLQAMPHLPLTPLLRHELRHAIDLYTEAIQALKLRGKYSINDYADDLNILYDQIKAHWTKINGIFEITASLQQSMRTLEMFLVSKLEEDYINRPYTPCHSMLHIAHIVAEQPNSTATNTECEKTGYYKFFVFPLEEMMLNEQHVKTRLSFLAQKEGKPASHILEFIQQRNWENLAAFIADDREIATKFFNNSVYSKEKYNTILKGINQIQQKYFATLTNSSMFSLTRYAQELNPELPVNQEPLLSKYSYIATLWS